MNNDDPPYSVGYRKPPQSSRFRMGQSGNPKGRPRGAKNFDTVISKELNTKVSITENGQRKKISKREAIGMQLVNKAASGDAKFVPILLAEVRRIEEKIQSAQLPEDTFSKQEDTLVLESIISRLKLTIDNEEVDE